MGRDCGCGKTWLRCVCCGGCVWIEGFGRASATGGFWACDADADLLIDAIELEGDAGLRLGLCPACPSGRDEPPGDAIAGGVLTARNGLVGWWVLWVLWSDMVVIPLPSRGDTAPGSRKQTRRCCHPLLPSTGKPYTVIYI